MSERQEITARAFRYVATPAGKMRPASVWFVIPLSAETAFRAAYGETVQGEALGTVWPNAAGTHGFVGTARILPQERAALLAAVPDAVAHDSWPPKAGWAAPEA